VTETTTVPSTASNGAGRAGTIDVENPATGKVIASVPVVAPEAVAEYVARARRAQPGWEALGFAGRAAVMKRCQRWCPTTRTA
jgi:acyl-CoA reductase-like NAD-dependent aldehyde dehydrogenase